jgi:hypothetical protein
MFNKRSLFVPAALVSFGLIGTSAAKADEARCYTLASLNGTYAIVTDYGDHVAQALAVRYFDGNGNMTGTFLINAPVVGSATGARTLTTGTQVGTYTVNCDGTGVITRVLTTSTGTTVTQTDDLLITKAVTKHDDGHFLATALADMTRTPSALVPGGLFVTRTYTRRPD